MAIDWKCSERGTKRQSVMGELLLLLLLLLYVLVFFFLCSCKLSANVTFLNFWTQFFQTKYALAKLGRLFCLTYDGKLSTATELHCINVSNSRDMLPLIGCWSVTTVWNNDIYFKETKKHWRRSTDIDSFSFRYILIDDSRWCFLAFLHVKYGDMLSLKALYDSWTYCMQHHFALWSCLNSVTSRRSFVDTFNQQMFN